MLTETPTKGRRVARVSGVALAALAVALLTPRVADAGCGPRPMLSPGSHVSPPNVHQRQAHAPERPAPCQGPNCSSAPDRAPLTPPPTAPVPADQYACLSPHLAVPGAGDGVHVRDHSLLCPVGHAARVERPPRS